MYQESVNDESCKRYLCLIAGHSYTQSPVIIVEYTYVCKRVSQYQTSHLSYMQNEVWGCLNPPLPTSYIHTPTTTTNLSSHSGFRRQLSLYELRHYIPFWDLPFYKLIFFKVFRILLATKILKAAIPRLGRKLMIETIRRGTPGLWFEGSRNLCGHR